MYREAIKVSGEHIADGLVDAIAYAAREGVLIKSISIDKDSFDILTGYLRLNDRSRSLKLHTACGMITVHSA
jgi:hypothetical protein